MGIYEKCGRSPERNLKWYQNNRLIIVMMKTQMLAKHHRRYLYTMLTNLAHNLYDVMCVIVLLIVKHHKAVLIRCEAQHRVAFGALHAAPSLSTKPTAPLLSTYWPMSDPIIAHVVNGPRRHNAGFGCGHIIFQGWPAPFCLAGMLQCEGNFCAKLPQMNILGLFQDFGVPSVEKPGIACTYVEHLTEHHEVPLLGFQWIAIQSNQHVRQTYSTHMNVVLFDDVWRRYVNFCLGNFVVPLHGCERLDTNERTCQCYQLAVAPFYHSDASGRIRPVVVAAARLLCKLLVVLHLNIPQSVLMHSADGVNLC